MVGTSTRFGLETIASFAYHCVNVLVVFRHWQARMKIAIIGSGVSGLTAAYRLHRHHEIDVFESADYIGGHTNTVDVQVEGERYAIDTGFIVFNDWTYPNFIEMLDEVGVESKPTVMSFSVRDDATDLEYNGHSLRTLFVQRRNLLRPRFYHLILDILRFNREAVRCAKKCSETTTVGQFLDQHRYSGVFANQYLLPMGAAIWSCPTGTFADFPIRFIVEFYQNHGLLSVTKRPTWRVISGGSRNYVAKLTEGFRDRIRLKTPIVKVTRSNDAVQIHTAAGEPRTFDHAIFACHSDQALRILGDSATKAERDVLSQFPYGRNIAVLHTDISALPRRRGAWAAWNYRVRPDSQCASVTYNMNLLQGIQSSQTFCVTLNDEDSIDPARVLRRFEYHHPIFTTNRSTAQKRHPELINANQTSFCGAYWGNGFHEDGVNSALAVVRRLNPIGEIPSNRPEDEQHPCAAGVAP